MPRNFDFIPPRRQKPVPAVRPGTILQVVEDGYSYTVGVGGARIQLFTQPAKDAANNLAVGDLVMARRVEPKSHLWLPSPQGVEELWFSPGAQATNYRAELWKYNGSGSATHVLDCPNNNEYITHLAWSSIDDELYMFTYVVADPLVMRVYRISRTAGTAALVATRSVPKPPPGAVYMDPVVDSAEKGSYLYLLQGAYFTQPTEVVRFDPVGGTFAVVFSGFLNGGVGGGIAIDAAGTLVGSDGVDAWRSVSGDAGSWVHDFDLTSFNAWDNFGLMLNKSDDGYIYCPMGTGVNDSDPEIIKRTGDGTWVAEYDEGDANNTGWLCTTQEYTGTTAVALWAQRWAFFNTETPELWRRAVGGAWTMDWSGPANHTGTYSQGLAQCNNKMYALFLASAPSTTNLLYRRDAAGSWTLVGTWTSYSVFPTNAACSGMAVAPNTNRLCHEV